MPINPEDFKTALESETTESILNLQNLCIKELSDESRKIPENHTDPEVRGGIHPTRRQ